MQGTTIQKSLNEYSFVAEKTKFLTHAKGHIKFHFSLLGNRRED